MSTQHTPESIKGLPHVTVEQVVRFREAALRIENERDQLKARNAALEQQLAASEQQRGELVEAASVILWRIENSLGDRGTKHNINWGACRDEIKSLSEALAKSQGVQS